MNFGLNRLSEPMGAECQKSAMPMKPRTLREQLQDQMAYHRSKIADLEEACEALTPDVEKALNALQKL